MNTSGRWLVTATITPASRTILHHSRTRRRACLFFHHASVPVVAGAAMVNGDAVRLGRATISLGAAPSLLDWSVVAALRVDHIILPPCFLGVLGKAATRLPCS